MRRVWHGGRKEAAHEVGKHEVKAQLILKRARKVENTANACMDIVECARLFGLARPLHRLYRRTRHNTNGVAFANVPAC